MLVDTRGLSRSGTLKRVRNATSDGEGALNAEASTWSADGDVDKNDEFFRVVSPGKSVSRSFDLRSKVTELTPGDFMLQVRYSSYVEKFRDGVRAFEGAINSTPIAVKIVKCERP